MWSTGANTQDVSSLSAGTYTVTITDANGCTYSISEVITQPVGALATNIAISPPVSCFGGSDGIVDISVSGGTPPYTYNWSNGATTQDITGLPAGVYTVTITDVNGCNATLSTTITQPPSPLMGSTVIAQNVSCFSGNDGIIDLTVTGGTAPYSYMWNNGFVSQDLTNMSAGTYNVTITDSKGCVTNASGTISQPAAALNAMATATQMVSCNGSSNGSINLSVTGGTTPYTFSWSNGSTTQNISGLTSALYTVTVTDANGCTSQDTITISQPVAPLSIITATTQNVNCFGDNTGAINITPNGGTAPYSYNWSNGANTEDLTSLIAGSYTVTITDANGCITSGTWLVSQPLAALTSSAVADPDVYCYGDSTGSANLTVSGGTTPYAYVWSNGSTTQDIFGLTAGIYAVTITDALGCTDMQTVSINQPAAPLAATVPSPVHVLCFGDSTGSINLLMSGGTAPYNFNWSNGATTEDLTSLFAGTYSVTVTDSIGCVTNTTVNITEPTAALTGSIESVTSVLCFGNSTGAVNIAIAGGTAPYTYNWSNGSTTQDITGLAAGPYTCTITDANGCATQLTATVNQPSAPLAIAPSSVQNVLCFGGSTGAVHIAISGGTGPYAFNWSNGSTTHDITFLPAGSYTVTVTDANGCTETLTSTITEPAAPLTGSTTITSNISCFAGNNGSIDLTVSGGTSPYSFLWSNGSTTEDISGLAAGVFTVTVTDINNCSIMITDSIVQPAGALALILNVDQNVSCNGGTDGSISLTVNGGTTPYNYNWSNGATTQNISNLPFGVYTVTVTDANGCNSIQSVGVSQPSVALNSSVSNLVDVLCHGDNSGILDIYVIGGTLPYTFNWSNGATTEDITGIGAGIYTVTITDANGCTSSLTDTITEPAAPLQDTLMQVVHVFCAGDQSGSLEIFVDGGTSPYSYQWSNGTSTSLNDSLAAGIYTVTVTDANGCSIMITDTVIGFAAISSTITMSPVLCHGDYSGSVTANITGGTAPYIYSWNTGDTTSALNNVQAGGYSVTITDVNGCTTTSSATVTEPQAPLSIAGAPYDADCLGGTGGGVNITVTGGTPGYSYQWSNGDTTQSLSGVLAGTFTLMITDANGCIDSAQYVVNNNSTLNVNASVLDFCVGGSTTLISDSIPGAQYQWYYNGSPLMGANNMTFNTPAGGYYYIEVTTPCGVFISDSVQVVVHTLSNISVSNPQFICPPESASLVATGGISYNWSPATNINFTNIPNPTVYPTESTIYTVEITNEYGCTTELSVPVSVICDSLLVPTGFSPNDDGVNDGYVIDDIQSYDGNKLWIYNRWGNLVYKAENYANEWDGVSNVKGMYFGRKVPSGTYFYILDLNEGSRPRSGYLIIKH
jgi:gliding motility-associated-like protein